MSLESHFFNVNCHVYSSYVCLKEEESVLIMNFAGVEISVHVS